MRTVPVLGQLTFEFADTPHDLVHFGNRHFIFGRRYGVLIQFHQPLRRDVYDEKAYLRLEESQPQCHDEAENTAEFEVAP